MTYLNSEFDNSYMNLALKEAKKAYDAKEVPVGCVIVDRSKGKVISSAHNMTELYKNPNLHAEMIAIERACQMSGNKFLFDCDIYITLEPCAMCAYAISNAKIARVYYAASDEKQGAVENSTRFYTTKSCFHRPEIYLGIQKIESEGLITSFFSNLRKSKI